MENENHIQPLLTVLTPLHEDVLFCLDRIGSEDSQFWRRAFVRALFAEMEGSVNAMKEGALAMSRRKGTGFSVAERIALRERTYELDDKGRVREQKLKIHLLRNIRFAFRAFAKASFAEYDIRVDGVGWEAFTKVVKIRDRITHPRQVGDLTITDEELDLLIVAFQWFGDCFRELLAVIGVSLKRKLSEFGPDGDPIVPNAT